MSTPPPVALAPRGVLGTDFRVHEVVLAVALTAVVQVAAVIALRAAALGQLAAAPEIDRGLGTPIEVRPVVDLDSPLLKLGGKKVKYKLPDQWLRQAPIKRETRKAHVSTKAGQEEEDIPPEELEVSDAGAEPDLDAALAMQADPDLVEGDGGPSNSDVEGSPDGVPEGTETDPLKARAVSQYRAKLIGWFSGRFHVHGSGLPQETLTSTRVPVTIQLSNGVVTSYAITPSGVGPFDSAAKAALASTVGQQVPPPPENYPDILQNQINVTFVCLVNKCD